MTGVANHVWQSMLFAIVAGLLTHIFRRNRAQVRYWIWFSASFKFLVPFALLMTLSSQVHWSPAARETATQITTPEVAQRVVQISQPFPEALPPAAPARDWIPSAIMGVWACGFLAVVLMRVRGWLRIRAISRLSSQVQNRDSYEAASSPEIRSSPGLLEPGVVGLWRPILLLPAGIEQRLTPDQLSAVIAHELCHVRRRDNLLASVHMLVEALFWFLPRVWFIGARLLEERERACDEAVLSQGIEPREYAEAILKVCESYLESPLACVSGVTGSNLKRRIEDIMRNQPVLGLNLIKKAALAAAAILALAAPVAIELLDTAPVRAQSSQKFEVASIRPGCGGGGRGGGKSAGKGKGLAIPDSSPGRLSVCMPLRDTLGGARGLIQQAYGRFANARRNPPWAVPKIEGGPAWVSSDAYAISARAGGNASIEMMSGPMLQALLEDRFKLKMHRESREVPVYALTVAKNGPKLQPFKEGSCVPTDWTSVGIPRETTVPREKLCADLIGFGKPPSMTVDAQGVTLESFTFLLGLVLNRPVIDKTGLSGRFNASLEFTPDQSTIALPIPPNGDAAPSDPTGGATIFTAIQEQLGLKLDSTRGPQEFLVIDHVERPSEN